MCQCLQKLVKRIDDLEHHGYLHCEFGRTVRSAQIKERYVEDGELEIILHLNV